MLIHYEPEPGGGPLCGAKDAELLDGDARRVLAGKDGYCLLCQYLIGARGLMHVGVDGLSGALTSRLRALQADPRVRSLTGLARFLFSLQRDPRRPEP
jgi:hypothetical protein